MWHTGRSERTCRLPACNFRSYSLRGLWVSFSGDFGDQRLDRVGGLLSLRFADVPRGRGHDVLDRGQRERFRRDSVRPVLALGGRCHDVLVGERHRRHRAIFVQLAVQLLDLLRLSDEQRTLHVRTTTFFGHHHVTTYSSKFRYHYAV